MRHDPTAHLIYYLSPNVLMTLWTQLQVSSLPHHSLMSLCELWETTCPRVLYLIRSRYSWQWCNQNASTPTNG